MNKESPSTEVHASPDGVSPATELWRLWQTADPPDVFAFLANGSVVRGDATTRLAVLRVDQRERWLRGERVLVEEYAARLHEEIRTDELLLDLLCSELHLQAELGTAPPVEELVARFPRLTEEIERMHGVQSEWLPETLEAVEAAESRAADTVFDPYKTQPHEPGPLAAPQPEKSSDDVFPRVGSYRILDELGSGGMGVVYRACDTKLKRDVALKMILPGRQAGAAEHSRFRLEAEIAAGLQHPHIVQVYEIGEHAGRSYTCMELVRGGSLADRIKQAPLAAREAAELLEVVARAIHFAHERGVLHRDLKPGNILLTAGGEPKVTDFGLAKRLDDELVRTHSGAMLGTPCYMPPEQARGELQQLGPRADVYALGAVLYESLTGRPPFRGESMYDTLSQVCRSEPIPPGRLALRLPKELETICLKCLAKQPARRYVSALALAEDLRRFLNHEPIQARPVGLAERAVKWCRRRPAAATLIAVCLAALALGIAGVLEHNAQLTRALTMVTKERNDAQAARELAQERLESANRSLYALRLGQVAAGYRRDPAQAQRLLEDETRCPPALRDFAWRYLHQAVQTNASTLELASNARCVAVHPASGILAAGAEDHAIRLWRISTAGGPPEYLGSLLGHEGVINAVGFDPSGRLLASASEDGTARLWDVRERTPLQTMEGHMGAVNAVTFSPGEAVLATAGTDKQVHLWRVPSGESLGSIAAHDDSVFAIAFSPDGKQLASGGKDLLINLWDVDSHEQLASLEGHIGWVTCLAFSPSGRLASGSVDRSIQVWDLDGPRSLATLQGHGGVVSGVAFMDSDTTLASTSYDGTARMWNAATCEETVRLRVHRDSVSGLAVAGNVLVTAGSDKTIRFWNPDGKAAGRKMDGHERGDRPRVRR